MATTHPTPPPGVPVLDEGTRSSSGVRFDRPGPPDVGHPPYRPVRDDRALGLTEDLDREPDGVPHAVVGLTALFSVVLAMLVAFMFLAGGTITRIGAAVLILLGVPTIVGSLRRKAERERDALHPSR